MSKSITVYDLLISCPSDVSEYIELLEREILHFNNFYGRSHDIIVRSRHWSKDSYAELGRFPQNLLNVQLVDSSDLILAVFWTRFGTPTENYGSGTEEEIERMLLMGKQVFLFFLDKPISPSEIEQEQYRKLQKFKERHKKQGIFFVVPDEKSLVVKFRENLELYFDSIVRGDSFKRINGKREVLWVDDRPENNIYERKALERYGLATTLALSTQQAIDFMTYKKFSLVISDMARNEGNREGLVLLDAVRKNNKDLPVIIYSSSHHPEYINEILNHGGQGGTSSPGELVDMVIKNLL